MGWYRTKAGRLLYGVGGLAAVYEQRGFTEVDTEVAEAEVASGEAQTRADVEGELAAEVDARVDAEAEAAAADPGDGVVPSTEHPVPLPDGSGLLITDTGHYELTAEEKADVDAAIAEESTGGFLR